MEWSFNICERLQCSPEDCIDRTLIDCGGRFWEKTCINHGEHLNLNENTSRFVPMRMAEKLRRMDMTEIDRINKRLGK